MPEPPQNHAAKDATVDAAGLRATLWVSRNP